MTFKIDGVCEINWKNKTLNGVSIVRLIYLLTILLSIFSFSGCNSTPNTYNKDYSNLKVFAKSILVKNEYQANDIIKQLDNSNDKLRTFTYLKKTHSIPTLEGNATNLDNGYWYDTLEIPPYIGNTIFKMNNDSYFDKPIESSSGWYVWYVEKKITQQQFSQLQADYNNKTLERIASYEIDYLRDHANNLKSRKEMQASYIQPYNKKENCKLFFGHYGEGTKWFEDDSFKVSWDGGCKGGFASGLGREIGTAVMIDGWAIAIYENGKPTYYIEKDVLSNSLFEGIKDLIGFKYGVDTLINVKANDIEITTTSGVRNEKTGINLLSHTSPFWNGSYTYVKEYSNFGYMYYGTQADDTNLMEYEFFLRTPDGKNGWAIGKQKNGNILTGEYINDSLTVLDIPATYNKKSDEVLKDVYAAQQKGFQAQEYAQKVKKQYLKRICKSNVKVTFMDNNDYKAICSNKAELAVMQLVSDKLDKMSQEKIARLENQRFNENQQEERQHREEMLAMERARLTEIKRHNSEAEAQANSDSIQRSWKNLNDQLRSMTPKTINVNHSGAIGLYNY
jgi:hypothetical protein